MTKQFQELLDRFGVEWRMVSTLVAGHLRRCRGDGIL